MKSEKYKHTDMISRSDSEHGESLLSQLALCGNQALLQKMSDGAPAPVSGSEIPSTLKSRVEARSGISMDGVAVYYQSSRPAAVGALAYTQGNQVYIGPGQERHLGHELGHVVQQMQGRVKPTDTINGQPINDDTALEREADSYR